MGVADILVIVFIVLAALGVGLYFLNRWASQKMIEQQNVLQKAKQQVTIFVIDKKKEKPIDSSLPKEVKSKLPKMYRFMKAPLVKAKIGPQIMTLMCEPKVFEVLPVKKSVRVELAGIYIAEMKGMKSKREMKELAKAKKLKATAQADLKWYSKIDPRKWMSKEK
ncbi:MAG: hypothetical protein LBT44_05675 [Clostridiales bacterium]|nr:hypothetical protein [Clostridiales bacterium]